MSPADVTAHGCSGGSVGLPLAAIGPDTAPNAPLACKPVRSVVSANTRYRVFAVPYSKAQVRGDGHAPRRRHGPRRPWGSPGAPPCRHWSRHHPKRAPCAPNSQATCIGDPFLRWDTTAATCRRLAAVRFVAMAPPPQRSQGIAAAFTRSHNLDAGCLDPRRGPCAPQALP